MPGFMRSVKVYPPEPGLLHDRVAAEIRRAISDGEAGPGERLPPARDLAAVLGVNRNTVLRARRIRRDRSTLAAACLLAFVVFCSFAGGPIASSVVGHTSTDQYPYAVNDDFKPVGLWTRVPDYPYVRADDYGNTLPPPKGTKSTLLVLGADGTLGRDELLRLLDGGRSSLEIGLLGMVVALL